MRLIDVAEISLRSRFEEWELLLMRTVAGRDGMYIFWG